MKQLQRYEESHSRQITRVSLNAPADTEALGRYASMLAQGDVDNKRRTSFGVHRLSLQKAMKDFHLHASTAEVNSFLKDTLFWEESGFNSEAYQDFVKNEMGPLGATVKTLNDLIREVICLTKLEEVLGAGIEVSREETEKNILSSQQRITYQLLSYPITGFRDKPMPSEEEVEAKWEATKSSYLSNPKRKVVYILAAPDYEAILDSKPAANDPTEAGQPGELKEQSPPSSAESDGCQEPAEQPAEQPAKDQLSEKERKEALFNLALKFGELDEKMLEGQTLSEAATDLGLTVETTELVEQSMLPSDFSSNFRNSPGTAGDAIFKAPVGTK
ncbi:MAG: hypothetical protein MK312_10845, partial [Roseibacillus sp.]|nr:hypothetical protein [Roseibacillus sp.]